MALSLAVKRPMDDLLDSSFHSPDSAIDVSPIKLLGDVVPPRGAKRRKDDFPNFIRPSANTYDAGDDSDDGAIFTEYREREMERPLPERHNFPCIWLNGNSPTRSPEPEDHGAAEVPRASPAAPLLEPLPKGTLIIQPSQPPGDDNQPPNLSSPSTPKSTSSTPNTDNLLGTLPPIIAPQNGAGGGGKEQPGSYLGAPPAPAPPSTAPPPPPPTGGDTSLPADVGTSGSADGMEVCPECHKVFKRKVYLQRHMEREHWSTAKVFKCEDCAYETKHQSNLSVHRRTHTGERPYHCGACGQRYTQGHLLKSHIRSRHGGNMEFYNLEKKSDSTRGRKSLDMKHEAMLGMHQKQDKISALLQAAAMSPGHAPGPMSHVPKFGGGGLLGQQYMNTLSYFSPLRPMMGGPMQQLPGGLLGSPRFFSLGSLGSPGSFPQSPPSLMPSLNPSMSLLGSQGNLPTSSSSAADGYKKSAEAMDMKPKMNLLGGASRLSSGALNPSMLGLQVPIRLPELPNFGSVQPKAPSGLQLLPQDLTTKKSPAEADVPEQLSATRSHMTSASAAAASASDASLSEPQDLSNPRYGGLVSGSSPARPQESDSATIPSPSRDASSSPGPAPAPAPSQAPPFDGRGGRHEPDSALAGGKSWPDIDQETPPPSDEEELVKESNSATGGGGAGGADQCHGGECPHLKKLKDLRRNVFRMLSVFTPDLSVENGISSETDDVDELLYEVIYTNIEEDTVPAASKE